MNLSTREKYRRIIGEAVVVLLESNKRVYIGNILDILEYKKHAASGHNLEDLRDTIAYIRSRI
ncbi:hypothetical protein TL99_004543 [Salmonella enterica subsp. enterica]|nr:hypothetical protein [Salmonella enterica subsp. enterica]